MKKKWLVLVIGVALIITGGFFFSQKSQPKEIPVTRLSSTATSESSPSPEASLMDVPLENQFTEPALENGCEVTALSMLLQFYGYQVDKNQLAELLDYVPLYEDETHRGDPREGFVGNIYGGDEAMGVWVEPIAKVAKKIVKEEVKSGSEESFQEITERVRKGTPVWILATVELEVPTEDDFWYWQTTSGRIEVTPLIHSVVITGINQETMYVNDPYRHKNRKIAKSDLEKIYESMGSQSLYLVK